MSDQSLFGGTGINIYNSDGTLIGNRVLTGDEKTLSFLDLGEYHTEVKVDTVGGFTILEDWDEDLWGFVGIDGQTTYSDITPTARLWSALVKGISPNPSGSPDDSFVGDGIFNNLTPTDECSFNGVTIDTATGMHSARMSVRRDNLVDGVGGMSIKLDDSEVLIFPNTRPHLVLRVGAGSSDTLPRYADDAAAGVAGLPTGQIYRSDGTGAAPLNIAGIVLIKQ